MVYVLLNCHSIRFVKMEGPHPVGFLPFRMAGKLLGALHLHLFYIAKNPVRYERSQGQKSQPLKALGFSVRIFALIYRWWQRLETAKPD